MSYHLQHIITISPLSEAVSSISSVALDRKLDHLAVGLEQGSFQLYSTEEGTPQLRNYGVDSPVSVLRWHPRLDKTLFVGCDSGDIHILRIGSTVESDAITRHHIDGPVRDIKLNATGTSCFLAGDTTVYIIQLSGIVWGDIKTLPGPPAPSGITRPLGSAIPISIQFIEAKKTLIVVYEQHGIIGWNIGTQPHAILWQKSPRTVRIGSAALSENSLAVTNLYDGVDVYELYRAHSHILSDRTDTFQLPTMNVNVQLPILYIEEGKAILVGSSLGYASICDSQTGEVRQNLEHSKDVIIQALDFAQRHGERYIVTAVAEAGQVMTVSVWRSSAGHEGGRNILSFLPSWPRTRSEGWLIAALLIVTLLAYVFYNGKHQPKEELPSQSTVRKGWTSLMLYVTSSASIRLWRGLVAFLTLLRGARTIVDLANYMAPGWHEIFNIMAQGRWYEIFNIMTPWWWYEVFNIIAIR